MSGLIGGLLLAWILTLFGVDKHIIKGLFELFRLDIGISGYYVLFALTGMAFELISRKR